MDLAQIQRIADCFKIGKVHLIVEENSSRFEIYTNRSKYFLASFKDNFEFDYKNILFEKISGELMFTEERFDKNSKPIPYTHKYNLYWCLLKEIYT